RVDSDSMRPDRYRQVLADFGAGKIDILLGTQMIGKGLDFPNVSVVGVLNADTALSIPDFRSGERTFQLIAQVAGRCGRAGCPGQAVVQTFLPDDPAVRLACRHDYDAFAAQELQHRQAHQMPPYGRLARIVLRDRKLENAELAARRLRQAIDGLLGEIRPAGPAVRIRGPLPAALARLEGYHRQEILIQAATAEAIQRLLGELRQRDLLIQSVHTIVDVDPMQLL
ncbi:MAG: hypothetical protein JW810_13940, partial [Sedimentisphaerales bacterium]|nr:hypothetical protein [Sedimentisphaerales bacterium]